MEGCSAENAFEGEGGGREVPEEGSDSPSDGSLIPSRSGLDDEVKPTEEEDGTRRSCYPRRVEQAKSVLGVWEFSWDLMVGEVPEECEGEMTFELRLGVLDLGKKRRGEKGKGRAR